MCKCVNMCWDFGVITDNGKWPIPDHHPHCVSHKQEEFAVIEYDGTRCILEPHEAKAWIKDSEEDYSVSTVMLTRDQFEKLPEFQGF